MYPVHFGPITGGMIGVIAEYVLLLVCVALIGGGVTRYLQRAGICAGALGGILDATQRGHGYAHDGPTDRATIQVQDFFPIIGSILAGLITAGMVAAAVTVVLDPFIWPSAIVGLPVGIVAGLVVTLVGFTYSRRKPDANGHWRAIGLGGITVVVIFALALGGLWIVGQERIAESYESTYEYQVDIDTNGTLENSTFYVPAPRNTEGVNLSDVFVENVRYHRYTSGSSSSNRSDPVNFSYDIVRTDHGQMIAISAERIEVNESYYRTVENETMGWTESVEPDEYDPDDPSMGVATDGHFTFSVIIEANESIDTANPFDTEPLLAPQYNEIEIECNGYVAENQRCFRYESRVFADYESDENTSVSVGATLNGRNEWSSGGWHGNEYIDRTSVEMAGPQTEWHNTTGQLEIGGGSYRR